MKLSPNPKELSIQRPFGCNHLIIQHSFWGGEWGSRNRERIHYWSTI